MLDQAAWGCPRSSVRGVSVRCEAGPSSSKDYRQREPKDVRVLVVGPTGYIGKFVVKELVARGYDVVAFAREKSGIGGSSDADATRAQLAGADVKFGSVMDTDSLERVAFERHVDVVVSCLASRTGGIKDSWDIDYQATLNALRVAQKKVRERGGAPGAHYIQLIASDIH